MIAFFAGIRALHFLSLMVLFGAALFEAVLRRNVPGLAINSRTPRLIAAFVALATALIWLALTAGQMSGDWSKAIDGKTIEAVLAATRFGAVFQIRFIFLLLLSILCVLRGWTRARALMAGAALAAISLTGHAAASGPLQFEYISALNDAVHLLAAGFWIGGLVLLIALLGRKADREFLLPALSLFSQWGMIAVTLLVMTGIINALTILLSGAGHPAMLYLLLLGIKIVLALGMIALAIFNRFRLMPQIAGEAGKLRASVTAELALGIAILALVGFLGLVPPIV